MTLLPKDDHSYRLPSELNPFQAEMYAHLISWKWAHITKEPGIDRGREYDAILPSRYADKYPLLYPPIVAGLMTHLQKFPFRLHTHFNHMASSQAANLNLFLPVLLNPGAAEIMRAINPQFARLATEHLDHGWRIEFWDEGFGALGDKSELSGTDSDIAIAYYNHADELCLWLIEHKLTEKEFTTCGGFRSKGRRECHDCTRSFSEILKNKNTCYYHDVRKFKYWDITEANRSFFANHAKYAQCPFQGGMNQLWRNQLLALAVEQDEQQPYQHAHFSVVRHPGNTALDASLTAYKDLIANNPKFSTFTSANVIRAAEEKGDASLRAWATWYKELYML